MSDLNQYLLKKIGNLDSLKERKVDMSSPAAKNHAHPFLEAEDYSIDSDYWMRKPANNPKPKISKPMTVNASPISKDTAKSSVANILRNLKSPELKINETVLQSQVTLTEVSEEQRPNSEEITSLDLFNTSIQRLLENAKESQRELLKEVVRIAEEKLTGCVESCDAMAPKLNEISQKMDQISKDILKSQTPIDRPTKAIISTISDKLINLAKLQEHEFSMHSSKLSAIEKKIGQPTPALIDQKESLSTISQLLLSVESQLARAERSRQVGMAKLEQLIKSMAFRNSHGDEDSYDYKNSGLEIHIQRLEAALAADQQISHARMSQFMDMFSGLQNAQVQLFEKVQSQDERQIKLDEAVGSIQKMLTSYLPLNLESKLRTIEDILHKRYLEKTQSSGGAPWRDLPLKD